MLAKVYMHLGMQYVLVNCLEGQSLPRNSLTRLGDWLDFTLIVLTGLKKPQIKQTKKSVELHPTPF